MPAVDRLMALERGDERPSRPVLVKMARQYRRPLLTFYLKAPPRRDDGGPAFRTLPGVRSSETTALLQALVRNLQSRQKMVRGALDAEDEAEPLAFVGSLLRNTSAGTGFDALRKLLQHNLEAARLARRARVALSEVLGGDLSAASYYAQPAAADAFRLLRSRTEDSGVFVLLKGDLGSHHTAIDVEAFRGLAIADDVAPFVVINDNDSKAAWSFTLLHELTHLLLGQSGFTANFGTEIEEFCNHVAGEWLLPTPTLDEIRMEGATNLDERKRRIGEFARSRNLSQTMVAYRLLRADRIDRPTFERLQADFREQWRENRAKRRASARESESDPTYFAIRRHRVGQALLSFTNRMVGSGALSTSKAARILGVKPAHLGKMLLPPKAQ